MDQLGRNAVSERDDTEALFAGTSGRKFLCLKVYDYNCFQ